MDSALVKPTSNKLNRQFAPTLRNLRAIEDSFPIVEINRLAMPERNSFKPIYQMHKWFARRASCVFRAILLGCLKSLPLDENGKPTFTGAEVIMKEFYENHTHDFDTNGKVILDPFMGGGTTVVEALRLGCKVFGIDLNPIAWFVVKTEVESVDLQALQRAFERLAQKIVSWSGEPLRETLIAQYKTECPCCGAGQEDADLLYTFWVKSAICRACGKEVPLFKDFIVARKNPSIYYYRDATCPKCLKTFDWETEPAALVAEPRLQVNSSTFSGGFGRTTTRWAFSSQETVECPWCRKEVVALPAKKKHDRKKVPLAVLLCPKCEAVWQWRGELPESVSCPSCGYDYDPSSANVPTDGKYLCTCGHLDDIIQSIRRMPADNLLPIHPFAVEGFCTHCGGEENDRQQENLFEETPHRKSADAPIDHPCRLTKSGGKFFKRVTPMDLKRIRDAEAMWEKVKERLPYPKQAISVGYNTNQMIKHNYRFWHQMFNPRQLLCLATLLEGIIGEEDIVLQEMLLSTFQVLLERNNLFCRFYDDRNTIQGLFARHDYQPKNTTCEGNVWGREEWRGTVPNLFARMYEAKVFATRTKDALLMKDSPDAGLHNECLYSGETVLSCSDSRTLPMVPAAEVVVTDPPYVGNVHYAELGDFFYVWLRLALEDRYPWFAPDETPKLSEVEENSVRGLSSDHFREGLTKVLSQAIEKIGKDGLCVFTFHHAEGSAWESVIRSVCDAGMEIHAAYPIHAEKETSLQLMDNQGISYDLIHVCRKRDPNATREKRSWAGIRQEIRRRAREEIAGIEAGRYGKEPLPPADVNIILIGKCLELYSRHYGYVVDHEDQPVELHKALKEIRDIADQITERERPLPSELDEVDPESRIYLRVLCAVKEVKSDEVHKTTRGILEPSDLIEAGLMTRGRAGRGRSYEVKQPYERLHALLDLFRDVVPEHTDLFGNLENSKGHEPLLLIDKVHLLLGLAEAGENLVPWLERFRRQSREIRAAVDYLKGRNKSFSTQCQKILNLMEVAPLFKGEN